jgi:hypothetical protein
MSNGSFFDVITMLSVAPHAFVAVDAALGQHPKKTVDVLRAEVIRWRDETAAGFSDADCERLARYLNRNFFRLEE